MRLAPLALFALVACSLGERSDFLIGRQCIHTLEMPCDEGQVCLPHEIEPRYADFRCRDADSFDPQKFGQEPPLAFCDELEGFQCPGDLVCNADRIRSDGGRRPLVCKLPGDVFAPPLDGGL